jgi:tetratricopeptide (TPR) repeat protein
MRRFFALGALLALPLLASGCDKITARDLVREANQLYADGQYEEAIAKYDEAEKFEPDGVTYLWNRACALESLVLKYKETEDEKELAARKEATTRALADFQTWYDRLEVKTDADAKAVKDSKLALLAVDQRCDELIAHWQNVLRDDPQNEGIYVNIAKIFEDPCGQPDKADEWYFKRTEDFPESARAWYEVAVRKFSPLMPDPESGLPYNASLSSDERLKVAQEVIGYLNKATSIAPQNRDPYVWRAMAYTQMQFARVYLDPPAGPEDRIEALNARNDSMLAWKEQKAVCDIDKIKDCPLERKPEVLFTDAASYQGKLVNLRLVPKADTIKEVDPAKLVYSFTANVAPPRPEPGAPPPDPDAPPPPLGKEVQVTYSFIIPEPPAPAEGEEPKPVDMESVKEAAKGQMERWKKGKGITFVGEVSADGASFKAAEQPIAACCPEAPLTPEEVAADAKMRAEAEAELAELKAKAEQKKGRGR